MFCEGYGSILWATFNINKENPLNALCMSYIVSIITHKWKIVTYQTKTNYTAPGAAL